MAETSKIMSSIQLLPAQLANQIAAGEVVERPASVVKELVENSIDAGADSIHIEIDQGGHKRILIRDTGCGIAKDELTLALSRHATSKIRDIDDLECISSMGFRGEALASISSVSRLKLTSRPEQQSEAWQAQAQGMDMAVNVTPAAHPFGTSIEVLDLFFNTPARRKFLRAQKTEFQHIEQIVRRIALAHPHIGFLLKHNGKLIFKYDAGDLQKRVVATCGNNFVSRAALIDYQHENIKLQGWCSKIGEAWPTNDQQYIFVNQRMIRDKLVLHAIRQAYEGMLPDSQFPAYILFLTLPAQDMDINVHPAKHEVRFHQSRQVHDVIFQAISQALVTAQALIEAATPASAEAEGFNATSGNAHGLAQQAAPDRTKQVPSQTQAPNHDYIRPLQSASPSSQPHSPSAFSPSEIRRHSSTSGNRTTHSAGGYRANTANVAEAGHNYQNLMSSQGDKREQKPYLILGNYLLIQQDERLSALPIGAVFASNFAQSLKSGSISQPLLMPVSIAREQASDNNAIDFLRELGCVIDSAHQKYILKEVPSALRALPWAHLFGKIMLLTASIKDAKHCIEIIANIYLDVAPPPAAHIQSTFESIGKDTLVKLLDEHGRAIKASALIELIESSAPISGDANTIHKVL